MKFLYASSVGSAVRIARREAGDDPPLRLTLRRGAETVRTVTVYPEQLWCDRGAVTPTAEDRN